MRLRQVLRPFRIPVDILVYTEEEVRTRKDWCSGPCERGKSFMTASTEEAILLLRKADQDIAAFDVLKNAPGIDAEMALFHAQQAMEKCLTVVLAFHGILYRKTHDLDELVDLVLDRKIDFPFPADAFSLFFPFAAQVRYEHLPLEGMSLERAESMIRDARTWAGSLMR